MALSSLTLYVEDHSVSIPHSDLVSALESLALIGEGLDAQTFLAGNRFFHQISFLGCAPNIPLSPEQSDQYLRIHIPELSSPTILTGQNMRKPFCKRCGEPISDWQTQLETPPREEIACSACQTPLPLTALRRGRRVCFTQTAIQIAPVFESEAIPSSAFMDTLSAQLGVRFNYAFTQLLVSISTPG